MKVTIKSLPKALNGIQVEDNNIKPISPSFQQILGKPHSEGGEMVQYAGQQVEMQGGEATSINQDGSLVAFGKLRIPSSSMTFEKGAKKLAEQENKNVKQADKAVTLINTSDPYDRFEALSFNSGVILGNAAQIKQTDLIQTKQALGDLQQDILDSANELGIAPEKLQKMKNGGTIKVKIKKVPSVPKAQNGITFGQQPYVNPLFQPIQMEPLSWLPQQQRVQQTGSPEDVAFVNDYLANSPDVYGNPGFIPAEQRAIVQPNAQGTLAQRNNNPGNLRFAGQTGATKGDGGFAKFDSYESGYQALLNDIKAKQTGKTRTKLNPNSTLLDLMNVYSPAADSNNPQKLAQSLAQGLGVDVNTKIGGLDTKKLADLIAINEDAAYARQQGNTRNSQQVSTITDRTNNTPLAPLDMSVTSLRQSPVGQVVANQLGQNVQDSINNPYIPYQQQTNTPQPIRNNFNYLSILPEVAAILDRPDYVQGQQYTPNLYEPYRVSYADAINRNQSTFNQVASLAQNNPAALGNLAAQNYNANQDVYANEFRQNQQIQNQVSNQNTELMNQAQLQNLQLADQQYTRQEQAKANTDASRQAALNSISQKVQQNQLVNNQLAQQQYQNRLIENFSGYRDLGNGTLQYQGAPAQFNYGNMQANPIQSLSPEQLKAYRQQLAAQQQQQKLQQMQFKTNKITQFFKGL